MTEDKYEKMKRLKERAEKGKELPIGGKATAMGEGTFSLRKDRKDASAAYDALQNIKEQEAEEAEEDYKQDLKKRRGYKKGGSVSSASSRADGCAQRGKTKGRIV